MRYVEVVTKQVWVDELQGRFLLAQFIFSNKENYELDNVQIFESLEFGKIRIVEIDNKPYVVGVDVTRSLEYSNPSKAVIQHCKGITKLGIPSERGGIQNTNLIPEGDIYRLIMKAADQSKSEKVRDKALKFERWIFDDIIPSIRKHGLYATNELLDNPDLLIQVATKLKEERQARIIAEAKLEEQKPLISFAETCLTSKDNILVRELAKVSSKNGISIGEKRLYRKLREWGLIMKDSTEPMQRSIDSGYFEVKQGTVYTAYEPILVRTPMVTPKGQVYIIERLKRESEK